MDGYFVLAKKTKSIQEKWTLGKKNHTAVQNNNRHMQDKKNNNNNNCFVVSMNTRPVDNVISVKLNDNEIYPTNKKKKR